MGSRGVFNIHSLNERDKRLMNKALEYNKKIRHHE